jgi:hypothetical protein
LNCVGRRKREKKKGEFDLNGVGEIRRREIGHKNNNDQ